MKLTQQQYRLRTSLKHTDKLVRVAVKYGYIEVLKDYSTLLNDIYERRIKVVDQEFDDDQGRHRSITDYYFPDWSPLFGGYSSESEIRFFNDNDDILHGYFFCEYALHQNELNLTKQYFDIILLRHIVTAPGGYFKILKPNPESWSRTLF